MPTIPEIERLIYHGDEDDVTRAEMVSSVRELAFLLRGAGMLARLVLDEGQKEQPDFKELRTQAVAFLQSECLTYGTAVRDLDELRSLRGDEWRAKLEILMGQALEHRPPVGGSLQ